MPGTSKPDEIISQTAEARAVSDVAWLKELVLRLLADQEKHFSVEIDGIRRELASLAASVSESKTMAEKMLLAATATADKAMLKAEAATHERLGSMNEFRQTVTDREVAFARKTEVDIEIVRMNEKMGQMNEKMDAFVSRQHTAEGDKRGSHSAWVVIMAIVSLGIAVATVVATVLK